MIELGYGFQLIGGVVGILDDRARLIGDTSQVAGAIVGVRRS